MVKLNVAVIGFGLSGRVFHASLISSLPQLYDIRYILTSNNAAEAKGLYPNANIVTDFTQIVNDKTIDLVIITSPNTSHHPLAKQCILAKKHVVVEKPFTVNSEEGRELIELAKREGVVLSVYHNRRWDGDFLTVKQLIEAGSLGRLVEFESHFDRYRNFIKPNAWRENDEPGSGVLFDLGSHLIDQALVLFGVPETVYADLRAMRDQSKTVDYFDVQLGYANVKVTLKSTSLSREIGPRFTLHGTLGSFVKYGLDPQEDQLKLGKKPFASDLPTWGSETADKWGKLNTTVPSTQLHVEGKIETLQGCYQNYYSNVHDAIVNRTSLEVTAEQALRVIKLIELSEQSSKEKKVVQVPADL